MPFDSSKINSIIQEARSHNAELPWIELKMNNTNPQEIGEYVSAMSNTAALYYQNYGFLIWGIDNETHKIMVPDNEAFGPALRKTFLCTRKRQ